MERYTGEWQPWITGSSTAISESWSRESRESHWWLCIRNATEGETCSHGDPQAPYDSSSPRVGKDSFLLLWPKLFLKSIWCTFSGPMSFSKLVFFCLASQHKILEQALLTWGHKHSRHWKGVSSTVMINQLSDLYLDFLQVFCLNYAFSEHNHPEVRWLYEGCRLSSAQSCRGVGSWESPSPPLLNLHLTQKRWIIPEMYVVQGKYLFLFLFCCFCLWFLHSHQPSLS